MIKPFYKIQKLLSVMMLAALALSWMAAPAQAAISTLLDDGFENGFNNWSTSSQNGWQRRDSTTDAHSGRYYARARNNNEGTLTSIDLDTSDALSITMDFWFWKNDIGSSDFTLLFYNGSTYIPFIELDGQGTDGNWSRFTRTINASDYPQYFRSNFRIQFDATLSSSEEVRVDDVKITKDTGEVLTVTKAGSGSGTVTSVPAGINCGSDCNHRYPTNQQVTLTAAANPGSVFDGWSGEGCSGTGTCTVTMSAARNVTATFVPLNPTLTVSTSGNGSGTVTSEPEGINCTSPGTGVCSQTYNYLDTVTLNAAPAEGSIFTGWSGACSGTGPCGVTMNANKSVTAVFTDIPPAIPVGLTAAAGDRIVDLTWTANTDPDLAGYNLYRSEAPGVTKSDTKVNSTLITDTSYQDSGLTNGKTYYYALSAVDTAGSDSDLSVEVSARPVDTVPPAAPANLTAVPGEHVVDLSWEAPADTDIAGYNLYRSTTSPVNTSGGPINTGLILGTTYHDSGLTNGTTYYYVVTAVDTSVNESALSNEVSAIPDDYTPPVPPVGLAATGVDQKVWLTWTANTEADLAGYNLYRGLSPDVPTTGDPVNGDTLITGTSYLDSGLTNGTTYYYVVTAVDQDGNESAASTPSASATPRAPTTYYVDNTVACADTGTGSGTEALPFCTISRGATLARAGDTVYVLNGTYEETVIPENSGIEGFPVTYQANPGVTVTGENTIYGSAFRIGTKGYIVVDGFTVTETRAEGIYVRDSHHISLTNNEVSYSGKPEDSNEHVQGIYLRNTTHSLIDGNITHHNTCTGIRLLYGSNYNTIRNNISYANASVVVSDAAGIELFDSSHNLIIHNITYDNEDSGINLYASDSGEGSRYNKIIGNLSYSNGDHGIDNHGSPYNTVVGNTVHGNGTVGINFEGFPGKGSHHATIANNIMSENGLNPPSGSFHGNLRVDSQSVTGTTADYDLFHKGSAPVQIIWNDTSYTDLALFYNLIGQEGNGREGDPLFTSPVVPVTRLSDYGIPYTVREISGDYHLEIGSPAIDSANSAVSEVSEYLEVDIEGNSRVDDPATANSGAGVREFDDRGAYEFQFADKTFTISGNAGVGGVVLSYEDGEEKTVTADENGDYSLTVPYFWSGTVTPSKAGYAFEPLSRSYTNLLENKPDEDYTATLIEYTLTVTTEGSGTVAWVPVQATYHYGDVVTLTATADTGWTFAGWSGDLASTDNPLRITIPGNTSLTATFTQDQYTLTVTTEGSGSVTKVPDQVFYNYGTEVTLTPVPAAGWHFDGWSGTDAGALIDKGEGSWKLVMDGSKSVTATFTQDEYTLTVEVIGEGSVTRNPDQVTYHYGDVVTLTATADTGWTFTGWSGDLDGSESTKQITMDGNKSVTATFTQNCYTLTTIANPAAGGTIQRDPEPNCSDGIRYLHGTTVELEAVSNTGYGFGGWSGAVEGSQNPITLLMDDDKTVTATFAPDAVDLTVIKTGKGTVEQDPEAPYFYDDEVVLTAEAAPGWIFDRWFVNTVDAGSTNPLTIVLTGDTTVEAVFLATPVTLEITIEGSGTVKQEPAGDYHYDDVVTLEPQPATGWRFDRWSGDDADDPVDNGDGTWSLVMDGDKSVTAVFTQIVYTLNITITGHGTVIVNPEKETYHYGDEVTLTAAANVGWTFSGWSGDLVSTDNPLQITISGNTSLTATFTQNCYTLTTIANPAAGGTIQLDIEPNCSDGIRYLHGTEVKLEAVPNTGYGFGGWSDDLAGSENPITLLMDSDKTVTAAFELNAVTLTVEKTGEGTVEQDPEAPYFYGAEVTLTPVPATGWHFVQWSGPDADELTDNGDGSWKLVMNGDKSVTAVFAQIEYRLEITIIGHGTVIVDPDKETYHYGEKIQLIAVPDPHYAFIGWSGDFSWTALDLDVEISSETNKTVKITATFTTTPQYSLFLPLIRR